MSKIVYLFGAGASAGTVPLVSEMPEWIEALVKDLKNEELRLPKEAFYKRPGWSYLKSKCNYLDDMIDDLKWLGELSSKHISIDTYAKKLYLKKDYENLKRLKIILSVFFVIEQIQHKANKRYDFFFASIMESINKFPQDIRILTWNYDSQFEIAFSEFSDVMNLQKNQEELNIHVKNKWIDLHTLDKFGIYKLNGSTEILTGNYYDTQPLYFTEISNTTFNIEILDNIVKMYVFAKSDKKLVPGFSFAWESENLQSFLEMIKDDTGDAEILVVIGYSFPYFNRVVDREIINNMKSLKRVHFQDLDPEKIVKRFKSIRKDLRSSQLGLEPDDRFFFIPDELSK
jgi:hypothetical protein